MKTRYIVKSAVLSGGEDMDMWNGMPVIINNYITKTVRYRTHKKRRIDKKWLKRYGYKEVQDDTKMYVFDGKLLMSQKCYDKIRDTLNRNAV